MARPGEASKDLCTLVIATDNDAETSLVLHNMYNPLLQEEDRQPHIEQIVVGDFNLYHKLWGGSDIRAPDREATELLDLMDDINLTTADRYAGNQEPQHKAALFKEAFFPPPPKANLEDIDNASYSNQIGLPLVSESEVEDAIQEAAPLKAPGPDGITNLALQVARPWITPHLDIVHNTSETRQRQLHTLLNTVGKIMDAIIARRLSYLAETHGLLPNSHMGRRRRRSKPTSPGYRRIDEATTEIHVDGFRSETYRLDTGILQGSPLLPILYLFYNADLLDSYNETGDTIATGFIDDVAILAVGDSTEETCQKLQEALRKAETWALTHASVFAPEKFQLTHFTRAKTRIDTDKALYSQWGEIKPKTTCKYLVEITHRRDRTSLGSSTTIYRGVVIPQMTGWARAARTITGFEQQIWKYNIDTISRVGMAEVTAHVTNEQHEHEHIPPFITPPYRPRKNTNARQQSA
ncbi:zinc knuckle [Colletotrichum cuscutae]|uniref:Zinc knuckle n=1 Tax=Colletotrichum cuscutae TaxID=1209917 RepID=A0AAI9U5M9_9PEZI|nr:zinc knuckle [Colletotrichum cuscutae]